MGVNFRDGFRALEVVGEGRREDARALRSRLAIAEQALADHYDAVKSIANDLRQDGFEDAAQACEFAALSVKRAEAELMRARAKVPTR